MQLYFTDGSSAYKSSSSSDLQLCVKAGMTSDFRAKMARALKALQRRVAGALADEERAQLAALKGVLEAFDRDIESGDVVHRRDTVRLVEVRTEFA